MLISTSQKIQSPQYIPESLNYKKTKKSQNAYSTTMKTKSQLKTFNISTSRKDRPKIKGLINHKLYEKYSSSQNYYYMKDVNAILGNQRIPSVIVFRDLQDQMKKEEVLRRFFFLEEYDSKFQQLTEYYKFHKEIPRIFSKNEYDIYFDYHDRKRKVDFVQITNMLKRENGEDPYLERKLELIRRRQKQYDPILNNLSSFMRSSYRTSMTPKNNQRYFLNKTKVLDQSSTILDIYDKLHDIVSLSSILSFENSRDISLDNLTIKSKIRRDNIGKNKSARRSKDFTMEKEKKLTSKRSNYNEINMETSLLFKKSHRDRLRSGISSEIINDKIMEIQFGGKKGKEKAPGNFSKKKKKNLVRSEVAHNRSKSRLKSKKRKSKKSDMGKKNSERVFKTGEEDKSKGKLGKFSWTRLNKNIGTSKKSMAKTLKRSKRKDTSGKLESKTSKKKASSNRNYSHKASKGSFATTRHKRESSLDRFREELSKFKFSKSTKQSQKALKSSRSKKSSGKIKGHYKTKSEIGLGNLAYLTRFDTKNSQVPSNNHLRRKSGGKLDFDFINEKKKNFFSKKKNEKSSHKSKKFQFDNIYKTRFSNLKQEMKFFKNQRKSKPITFGSGGSKKSLKTAKVSAKRSKKYMAKKNHHRVESLSDMKFLKKSREKYNNDRSNLFSGKILNKSKEPIVAKRGKHKHTRSEPEKLLMHNFIKKNEQEVNFKAFGGFKNLVEVGRNNDFRRESQPFNSYRSKRRGNSGGAANFGKLLYSSRNV